MCTGKSPAGGDTRHRQKASSVLQNPTNKGMEGWGKGKGKKAWHKCGVCGEGRDKEGVQGKGNGRYNVGGSLQGSKGMGAGHTAPQA